MCLISRRQLCAGLGSCAYLSHTPSYLCFAELWWCCICQRAQLQPRLYSLVCTAQPSFSQLWWPSGPACVPEASLHSRLYVHFDMCALVLQGFDPESPDPQAHLIDQPYQKPSAQPASAGTQLTSDAMTERRMVPAADLKAKAKEWLPAVSGLPVPHSAQSASHLMWGLPDVPGSMPRQQPVHCRTCLYCRCLPMSLQPSWPSMAPRFLLYASLPGHLSCKCEQNAPLGAGFCRHGHLNTPPKNPAS